jgi:hypothetical protein
MAADRRMYWLAIMTIPSATIIVYCVTRVATARTKRSGRRPTGNERVRPKVAVRHVTSTDMTPTYVGRNTISETY